MQIETYEIEEITGEAGNMAADAEAIELADRLGLEGQKTLCKKDTLTRIPYPKLTAIQQLVFTTMFPCRTDVRQYSEGIIPLRVLQVVSFCRENSLYARLEVWHPEPGKVDPVLIGTSRESTYHNGDDFLLARWGTALEPFEDLLVRAKAKWIAAAKARITSGIKNAECDLANLLVVADDVFETGQNKTAYYSGF